MFATGSAGEAAGRLHLGGDPGRGPGRWPGSFRPGPDRYWRLWPFLAFLALAIVLDLMVVPLAGGSGASTSFAIYFGGLLAFGVGPTVWVAAMATLWSDGLLKRRGLVKTGFNASHSVLSLLAAAAVYRAAGRSSRGLAAREDAGRGGRGGHGLGSWKPSG